MSTRDMIESMKFRNWPHEVKQCAVILAAAFLCQSVSAQSNQPEMHIDNQGHVTFRNMPSRQNSGVRTYNAGTQTRSTQNSRLMAQGGQRHAARTITGGVYRIYNDGQANNSAIIQCDGGEYLLIENPGNGIKWMNNAKVTVQFGAGNSMVVTQSKVFDRYDTPMSAGHEVYDRVKNIYVRVRQVYNNPDRIFRDAESIGESIEASVPTKNTIYANAFMGHRGENGNFVKDYQVNGGQNVYSRTNGGMGSM